MISNTNAASISLACLKEMLNKLELIEIESKNKDSNKIRETSIMLLTRKNSSKIFKASRVGNMVKKSQTKKNFFKKIHSKTRGKKLVKYHFTFKFIAKCNSNIFPIHFYRIKTPTNTAVGNIFAVNFIDLAVLLDFTYKCHYLQKKILRLLKPTLRDSNRIDAIKKFSGYFFAATLRSSLRFSVPLIFLKVISIDLADFSQKKIFQEAFLKTGSTATAVINIPKRLIQSLKGNSKNA